MTVPFVRQLGFQSGVQLNPIKDNSERSVPGNADQVFATVGRFSRGRIDKAFRVNKGNLLRMLGDPVSPTVNRLNETLVHIYEALQNGAYEAVVSRLHVEDAVLSLMVAKNATGPTETWAVEETATTGYLLSVKHLECINEGVRISINADAAEDDLGDPIASTMVTLRIQDLKGVSLYPDFYGSLDPLAKDEFDKSIYLPSVISELTDAVEVVVNTSATVLPTSNFYGVDVDGLPKFVTADLVYFDEVGTSYASTDIDVSVSALKYSDTNFGYLTAGASRSPLVISKMIALGVDINKQCLWDVPGNLSPAAAITFYNQLNIDTHYSQAYWAPLKAVDPLNGGKDILGTSGVNVGMRCRRNAVTDSNGVPPKNFVVAGKAWPLTRVGIVQVYTPSDNERSDLAKARINPVVYERYNNTSAYVFVDSLTGAKTEGDRKLIAVADMSSQVDDWVTAYFKELLQLPMTETIRRGTDFLRDLFEGLETAKWLIPSAELEGRAFYATIEPNAQRPKDRVDVSYWLSYDGTTRAIYVQQTIAR